MLDMLTQLSGRAKNKIIARPRTWMMMKTSCELEGKQSKFGVNDPIEHFISHMKIIGT